MVVFQKMLTLLPNHPPSGDKNASVLGFQDTNTIRVPGPFAQRSYIFFTVKGPRRVVYVISFLGTKGTQLTSKRPSSMLSWSLTVVLTLTTSRVRHFQILLRFFEAKSGARNWPWSDSPHPNYFYPLQISFYRQCCIKSTGTAWCFQFQASGRAVPFASSSTSLLQIWSSVAALNLSTARCMPRKAIAKKSRQGIATKSSSKSPASPNTCIHTFNTRKCLGMMYH